MLIGVGFPAIVVIYYVMDINFNQQLTMFFIKSHSYSHTPTTLPVAVLDAYVLEFCSAVGPDHCSVGALSEFMRDRVACSSDPPIKPYLVAFSAATEQTIALLSAKVLSAYVLADAGGSKFLQLTSDGETTAEEHAAIQSGELADKIKARLKQVAEGHGKGKQEL